METAFFIASKTVGMIARAESWLMLGLLLTLFGIWRGRRRLALGAAGVTLASVVLLTIFPLGDYLLRPLEAAYPVGVVPGDVRAIIVLGGAERTGAARAWGGTQLTEGGERALAGAELARRFPQALLVFSGGEAGFVQADTTTAPSAMVRQLWLDLGIAPERILLEQNSRNTVENARFTRDLLAPQPGQNFVLVTSAFHMPRAMQSFATAGWQGVTAWPVDFRSGEMADGPTWKLDDHLAGLDVALKEYLGLLVYRVTGR